MMRRPDDEPARPTTPRQRLALVVALAVVIAAVVALALLPGAPPEPGFARPTPTSEPTP